MPSYGRVSSNRLRTCDPLLVWLFNQMIEERDITILCGHRGKTAQDRAFDAGRSQVRWPDGQHNKYPSHAIDAAPWPVPDWESQQGREDFLMFGSWVVGFAAAKGVALRCGNDWDGDGTNADQTFDDLVHFELITDQ